MYKNKNFIQTGVIRSINRSNGNIGRIVCVAGVIFGVNMYEFKQGPRENDYLYIASEDYIYQSDLIFSCNSIPAALPPEKLRQAQELDYFERNYL